MARIGLIPYVSVVRRLVLRRQFYRAFSVPMTLRPIIESLSGLEELIYEPWRGFDTQGIPGRFIRDGEYYCLFTDAFKAGRSLKKVHIFEDINMTSSAKRRECYFLLGRRLADFSQGFEEVYASQNVDAEDFFYRFWPGANFRYKHIAWKHLRNLALTSHFLTRGASDKLI